VTCALPGTRARLASAGRALSVVRAEEPAKERTLPEVTMGKRRGGARVRWCKQAPNQFVLQVLGRRAKHEVVEVTSLADLHEYLAVLRAEGLMQGRDFVVWKGA